MADTKELIPYKDLENIPVLVTKQNEHLAAAKKAVAEMPEVVDEATKARAFELRQNIINARDYYKEHRMPFTRALDALKKEFTSAEAAFNDLLSQVEKSANKYAEKQLAEQRKAAAEAEAKLNAEKQKIEQMSRAKITLKRRIDEILSKLRAHAGTLIHDLTEENKEETEKRLSTEPQWTDKFNQYYSAPIDGIPAEILAEALKECHDDHVLTYTESAKQIMADSKNLIPVALKNKEDAERLAKAEADRQAADAARLEEQEKAAANAHQAIATLDNPPPPEPDVKTKFKIDVESNEAWLKIIAFWYQHDPKAKERDLSKIFSTFKTFAERKVNKDGTRIEHPGVKYVEEVKAKK